VFQFLKDPSFDFMGKRGVALPASLVLVLASVVVLAINGLHLGIEFTGGTEMQVKYAETPDVAEIRSTLNTAGFGTPLVTTIGDPSDNEVYIRLASRAEGEDETETEQSKDDPTIVVLNALRGLRSDPGQRPSDLNIEDEASLATLLGRAPGAGEAQAQALAAAILEARREGAIFAAFGDLSSIEGMTPEIQSYLEDNATIGPLALRSQSYIGPAVGRELVEKAIGAIIGSLIGMLLYIWYRFKLQWGFAAVAALTHDTLVTLALFSIFKQEMSLPVVAAFLTLVGYSVNDTVVVFDRIRENLASYRGKDLADTVNMSINQTLSRTIITSGLTWVVVLSLFLFGGAALRPFSFVLTVGVVVGTYSSIYVASPIVVIWQSYLDKRRQRPSSSRPATERRGKKVRRSSTG
jgi:preprotein translocase subunit SecF